MKIHFNTALALSLGIHMAIFAGLPIGLLRKTEELSQTQPKTEFVDLAKSMTKRPQFLAKENSFKEPPPYIDLQKDLLRLEKTKDTLLKKPTLDSATLSTKEVVFVKSEEKLDSFPAYIEYYDTLRGMIEHAAHSGFHSPSSGKIFLNFTVDNLGNLIAVYLDERKSSHSKVLRGLARKSIESSSPFPEFPQQLKQFQTLTFNLSIHFRNN
ncbi:hypothetical protein ACFL5X_00285 [Candidatus Omnitrophota bacterium]